MITTDSRVRGRATTRVAWAALGIGQLAFALFESVKHGGATWALLAVGLIGPDLAMLAGNGQPHERGQLPPRAVGPYNALHQPFLPLAVLAAVIVVPLPDPAAPFTLGLAWLAHIAVDRACGYGPRTAEGWQRG